MADDVTLLFQEVVQGKSDSSENQEKESPVIENKAEASEFGTNECSKSQNASDEAGCDKHSDNDKEEIPVETEKKGDEELKVCKDFSVDVMQNVL